MDSHDAHDAEYRGAVEGMAEVYGIPESHVLREEGKAFVFWVNEAGHLANGPVVMANADEVVVQLTSVDAAIVPRVALKPVPRFFGGHGA